MLVQLVGPKNSDQVVLLMKQVRMEKNPEDINMSLAADYIRRWKDVACWGRRHLLKQKTMIKAFIEGVYPKRLSQSLINEDCRLIEECMTSFLDKFRTWVAAKQTADSYDDGEPRRTEEKAKPSVKGGTQSESKAKPKTPDTKSKDDGKAKAPIICHHCQEPGHIRPDCPKLRDSKSSAAAAAPPKKVAALVMGVRAKTGPWFNCDLSARSKGKPKGVRGAPEPWVRPDGGADRVLRMLAHLDIGAELDAVGENQVKI